MVLHIIRLEERIVLDGAGAGAVAGAGWGAIAGVVYAGYNCISIISCLNHVNGNLEYRNFQ